MTFENNYDNKLNALQVSLIELSRHYITGIEMSNLSTLISIISYMLVSLLVALMPSQT
jgi:hypothetical protein